MADIQRNFVNQNPDGKFKKEHSHDKTFEVHVDGGDLIVHGDLSCNGTIYDTSGNDLVARVNANTIAVANAINQVDLNATNIATNVGFINQNIGAIAENTLSASNNATLISALGIVQGTQATAITANSNGIEDNTADILSNTNAITAHDTSINRLDNRFSSDLVDIETNFNGEYAQMRVSTNATDTNDMRLTFKPKPNNGTQKLQLILDNNTRFGSSVNFGGRIILKENGFWARNEIITGSSSISRVYFSPQDSTKPLYVIIQGNLQVSGTYPSSDDRIKNNEKVIENATETLLKLKPQTYNKFENMDCTGPYTTESGLIAQQVWYAAPELRHCILLGRDADGNEVVPDEDIDIGDDVTNDPDYSNHGWSSTEHSAINYNSLIGYLIKSNQELHERLTKLENK